MTYPIRQPPDGDTAWGGDLRNAVAGVNDHQTRVTAIEQLPNAKGDLVTATAADTLARLAVGTNGQVLTAQSGQATGLQWASSAAGYATVQDEGTARTQRATVNFVGAGVSATDDAGNSRTVVTIPGGSTSSTQTTPEDFGAVAGSGNNTTAIQNAINYGRTNGIPVFFPRGYSHSGTLKLDTGDVLFGVNELTTITYTGTGTAWQLVAPTVRSYTVRMSNLRIETATGAIGIDIGFLSGSVFEHMTVSGFTTAGWRAASSAGECVYNRFYNASATFCGDGWKFGPGGANSNSLIACLALNCTNGVKVLDSNQNMVVFSQFETCTTGVRIQGSSDALSDANFVSGNRFEDCTTTVAVENDFIRDTIILYNAEITGDPDVTQGTRTIYADSFRGATHRLRSYTTGGRPDLTSDGSGAAEMVWDSTLGQPIWWDGSGWVNASGTSV